MYVSLTWSGGCKVSTHVLRKVPVNYRYEVSKDGDIPMLRSLGLVETYTLFSLDYGSKTDIL